jgi:hypothetical protein
VDRGEGHAYEPACNPAGAGVTLREAIESVLHGAGRPMRSREIAEVIANNGYYVRRDGSQVPPGDVNVLANDTKQVFHVDRGLISLREWDRETSSSGEAVEDVRSAPQSSRPADPTREAAPARGVAASISEAFWTGALDVSARPRAPRPTWSSLPEVRGAETLRHRGGSSIEVRLWLTFVAAMDRARDADALWAAAARLHAAEPWVFDPATVANAPLVDLIDALRSSGVSQRHSLDSAAWRLIAETLADPAAAPNVNAAIHDGAGDADTLLAELQVTTERGTPRFPLLRGPKVGPMWVRMLAVPGDAAIRSMASVPVAVDVQVRRITEHLGVAPTAGMELDAARPIIQDAWAGDVAAHGTPGPPGLRDTAAALDPALWFWGKWGCSHCESVGRQIPIGQACAGCDLPPRT